MECVSICISVSVSVTKGAPGGGGDARDPAAQREPVCCFMGGLRLMRLQTRGDLRRAARRAESEITSSPRTSTLSAVGCFSKSPSSISSASPSFVSERVRFENTAIPSSLKTEVFSTSEGSVFLVNTGPVLRLVFSIICSLTIYCQYHCKEMRGDYMV